MIDQTKTLAILFAVTICSVLLAFAQPARNHESAPSAAVITPEQADNMRLEGEKRFHSNCGRCHVAPHKFPPRTMGSVVRHMRVRATITDEDMRLILYFLNQ